jgi:hypothetical protein
MTKYLYLHGFASSPQSQKAQYFKAHFQSELNISLVIPDLNQDDFSLFTLTRAIAQSSQLLKDSQDSWVIIGSSLGGLLATLLAQEYIQVARLVLLAPAFDFLATWSQGSGRELFEKWREDSYYPIYHYAKQQSVPLGYHFVEDAKKYLSCSFKRELPTSIFHGVQDQTIPIENSRRYLAEHPWATLKELSSDHGLANVLPEIWRSVKSIIPAL